MYLNNNWKTPEEYVISKFQEHDYVFLGEMHRIKHDVELISNLIPVLYKNKICCLGIEFGDYSDQTLIDSMLKAPEFDRKLARSFVFDFYPAWAYKEYVDLYQ
ncbi:MAG: hypothetical protein JW723_15260 [Bacteroidales bacterium]|nr:hypothetical protein [Bacteroidales bacterium]